MSTLQSQLRQAIVDSEQTTYAIARDAGVASQVLYRFVAGQRDLTLATAGKLATHLGLELAPTSPKKRTRRTER